MAQNNQQFRCPGDCMLCNRSQWQYCAAQFTYNSMVMLEKMEQSIKTMQGTVEELNAKVEAIQSSEADVFNPSKADISESVVDLEDETG